MKPEKVVLYGGLVQLVCVVTVMAYFHQPTFLEPVYDKYGYEITGDRVLEITALMSTSLGYGLGWNYSNEFSYSPLLPPVVPPYLGAPYRNQPRYGRAQQTASGSGVRMRVT